MTTTRQRNSAVMKVKLLVLIAFSFPAAAQVPQQDPCPGIYGFAREDCLLQRHQWAQDAERKKQVQQDLQQQLMQLQQQLFLEQIRGQQLQNEALRRRLEAEDAAMKRNETR